MNTSIQILNTEKFKRLILPNIRYQLQESFLLDKYDTSNIVKHNSMLDKGKIVSSQHSVQRHMKFHMCTKWDEGKSWFRVAWRMMAWVETKPSDTYPAKENNRKCNVCTTEMV